MHSYSQWALRTSLGRGDAVREEELGASLERVLRARAVEDGARWRGKGVGLNE